MDTASSSIINSKALRAWDTQTILSFVYAMEKLDSQFATLQRSMVTCIEVKSLLTDESAKARLTMTIERLNEEIRSVKSNLLDMARIIEN